MISFIETAIIYCVVNVIFITLKEDALPAIILKKNNANFAMKAIIYTLCLNHRK
jgi:hypothetical protein